MERCRQEIAAIQAELRAGNPDVGGLLLALADWHAELRLREMIPADGPNCCPRTKNPNEGASLEHES